MGFLGRVSKWVGAERGGVKPDPYRPIAIPTTSLYIGPSLLNVVYPLRALERESLCKHLYKGRSSRQKIIL